MYIKYSELEEKLASRMDSIFSMKDSFIEVNPGRVLVPPMYKGLGQRILDLDVRPDDVWLCAYPRTGSTWTLEMVWCIMNNLDFEQARSNLINFRSPLIEVSALMSRQSLGETGSVPLEGDSVSMVESMHSPRCIRSHMPLPLLPKQFSNVKPKIVYVTRNPKDVCVSYYHYCKNLHNLNCSFEDFCELFLEGKSPIGSYMDHVLGFWQLRDEPNVLFVKYEDMKKDCRAGVRKIANFLGKVLTEEQITSLIDHASFKKMQENPAVNLESMLEQVHGPRTNVTEDMKFIRKGQVGDWKNHMNEEMSRRFDKWIEEKLMGSGLSFDTV